MKVKVRVAKPAKNAPACDARTKAWFATQPFWRQTCLHRCEVCGLWYKPDLGHECDKLIALLRSPAGQAAMREAWPDAVRKADTKTLQQICRLHANDDLQRMAIEDLFVVLEELARRREISGTPFRSDEEAWAEFQAHYMPHNDT